jgi:hypothetical protein
MASKPIYSTYGEADQLVKDYYNRKGIPFDVNRYTTDVQALEGGRVAPSFYGGGSGSGSGYGVVTTLHLITHHQNHLNHIRG